TGIKNRLLDDVVDQVIVNAVENVKESISNGIKDSSFNSCLLDKLEGSLVKIFKKVSKPKTKCLLGVSSPSDSDTFGSNVLMDIQKPNATVNELIEVSVKDRIELSDKERGISSNFIDNDGMENDFSGVALACLDQDKDKLYTSTLSDIFVPKLDESDDKRVSGNGLKTKVIKTSVDIGYLEIFLVATSRLLKEWHGHYRAVTCLVLSMELSRLISDGEDGFVRVWSLLMIFEKERQQRAGHLYEYCVAHCWDFITS
ncbi:protein root initiation defective 3, partial [Tanacetum coccineum]